jgi:hypothetical protein
MLSPTHVLSLLVRLNAPVKLDHDLTIVEIRKRPAQYFRHHTRNRDLNLYRTIDINRIAYQATAAAKGQRDEQRQ